MTRVAASFQTKQALPHETDQTLGNAGYLHLHQASTASYDSGRFLIFASATPRVPSENLYHPRAFLPSNMFHLNLTEASQQLWWLHFPEKIAAQAWNGCWCLCCNLFEECKHQQSCSEASVSFSQACVAAGSHGDGVVITANTGRRTAKRGSLVPAVLTCRRELLLVTRLLMLTWMEQQL